jgi:multicomponent Na+:H+ antiporter subunit E
MNMALIAIILAVIWAAITTNFTLPNLVLGGVIALVALWFIREQVKGPSFVVRVWRILSLAVLFFYELLLSAVRVAILVLTPDVRAQLKPAIIAFPLTAKSDVEITLLANLITLTPGTLSVDVSEDRKYIYVHALSVENKKELIESIATGFEAKIMKVFQ